MDDFDLQFNEDRRELADYEYYIPPVLEEEEEIECTCKIEKETCLVHGEELTLDEEDDL